MKFKKILLILFYLLSSFIIANDRIAYIYYVDGASYIKNNRVEIQYKDAIPGRAIYSGDVIKVNENSKCSIYFEDKTSQIIVGENSRVQIIQTNSSKEIKVEQGNIFIHNLYNPNNKFYVLTNNNQYFLENDRVWISSDIHDGDRVYSLDYPINIFNKVNKRSVFFDEGKVHYYFNSGKMMFSNVIDEVVPKYVLDKLDDNIYEVENIDLKRGDLIPVYGKRIRSNKDKSLMSYSVDLGSVQLNSTSYYKIGFYPKYKHNNLGIGFSFDPIFSSSGELLNEDWNDAVDLIDRVYINYYYANNDKNNEVYLHYGQKDEFTFAQGYLLNKFNNNLDYPRLRNSGLYLDYKFDDDFMDLQVAIPNFSEFASSGGVIAARTSLYISHKFPMTLGLGFVADINQMSSIENQYDINFPKKRNVYGLGFDLNYDLFRIKNIDFSIFGEMVGIWFPESIYYVLFDDANNVANDLRYRKGVWGVIAPGLQIDFNNRLDVKLSYNHNSALFMPSYFNSNYLMNRTRYYQGELNFPLVNQQINLLNGYEIPGMNDEFIIPKDLYPILFQNKGFSPHQVKGFTTEISYNIRNYLKFSGLTSIYIEDVNNPDTFYSLDYELEIMDNFIKRISFIKLYYSNIFFSELSDKERMTFGLNVGVELPLRLSLIIDVRQVYYDLNLTDNNLDQMINTSLGLKYKF